MITRRQILCALTAALIPDVVAGQIRKTPVRIGILGNAPTALNKPRREAFRAKLRELGHREGENVVFESRSADGRLERFPALAKELVDLNVDIIVCDGGTPATQAAMQATWTIPIVFFTLGDPVAIGAVKSLARPGGNVTGLGLQAPDVVPKRLQLLREILPDSKRIAYLTDPNNPGSGPTIQALRTAANARGLELEVFGAKSLTEFEAAFEAMAKNRINILLIGNDSMLAQHPARLASLASKFNLPTIAEAYAFADNGVLLSFGADRVDMARRAAVLVDKIIKGAKPGDLPVELPTKFELVVNMKTAKSLGIKVPQSVLLQADRVIE
jgi:putative tryptophan/tyrosine transport system substrate-binding protein